MFHPVKRISLKLLLKEMVYIVQNQSVRRDIIMNQPVNRLRIIWSGSMKRLINAGQVMIKEKFPHEFGLQDVGKNDTGTFEGEDGNFVQILNCHNTHWIKH